MAQLNRRVIVAASHRVAIIFLIAFFVAVEGVKCCSAQIYFSTPRVLDTGYHDETVSFLVSIDAVLRTDENLRREVFRQNHFVVRCAVPTADTGSVTVAAKVLKVPSHPTEKMGEHHPLWSIGVERPLLRLRPSGAVVKYVKAADETGSPDNVLRFIPDFERDIWIPDGSITIRAARDCLTTNGRYSLITRENDASNELAVSLYDSETDRERSWGNNKTISSDIQKIYSQSDFNLTLSENCETLYGFPSPVDDKNAAGDGQVDGGRYMTLAEAVPGIKVRGRHPNSLGAIDRIFTVNDKSIWVVSREQPLRKMAIDESSGEVVSSLENLHALDTVTPSEQIHTFENPSRIIDAFKTVGDRGDTTAEQGLECVCKFVVWDLTTNRRIVCSSSIGARLKPSPSGDITVAK